MTPQKIMKIIFGISIVGVLFSGYLSYYELFVPAGCSEAVVSCGPNPVNIASLPACVYGLIMYLVIFGLSLTGVIKGQKESN